MNQDISDLKKKLKAHENRSDSFTDNDTEPYQGFKTSNLTPYNSRSSYHQDRTPERRDSSNFPKRRSSVEFSGINDLSDSNDKIQREFSIKKVGESSRLSSSGDMMETFMQSVFEIRAKVKKTYLTCESPKTNEDLKREVENKQVQMMEVSFIHKYGSNMTSVTELKWGSPIKPSGNFQKTEPEKSLDFFFANREKKPCYMPNSPSGNTRNKSTPLRPYDMPDSPTTSISTDNFHGYDRASKRKASHQITNYANEEVQSDEDNETCNTEVTKKRKNNKGKNKNPQSKAAVKKNGGSKNQRKLFNSKNEQSSLINIEMEEEPFPPSAKEITTIHVTDDEDEEIYVAKSKKNMSISKRMSLSVEQLKQSQEKQRVEEQERSDEAFAKQLMDAEEREEKKMEANIASRSSSIPQTRPKRKNNTNQKEEIQQGQVVCPICNKEFGVKEIETHAANCQCVD